MAKTTRAKPRARIHVPMKGMKGGIKTVKKTKKTGLKGGAAALVGGAAGAVIGATIGGVAVMALSDQKTRKIVGERINEFAKTAVDNSVRQKPKGE